MHESLFRVVVKGTLQQVTAAADFGRARHGTPATACIRTKRNSGDSFVKGDSVGSDVVDSVIWDGQDSSSEALRAHGNDPGG
jgi:hypothetical protein